MSTYVLGNVIRISTPTPFTDQDTGDPVDPLEVKVLVWRYGTTPVLDDAVDPTNDEVGIYHYDFEPDSEGVWYYRIFSDEDPAAAEGSFRVTSYLP